MDSFDAEMRDYGYEPTYIVSCANCIFLLPHNICQMHLHGVTLDFYCAFGTSAKDRGLRKESEEC